MKKSLQLLATRIPKKYSVAEDFTLSRQKKIIPPEKIAELKAERKKNTQDDTLLEHQLFRNQNLDLLYFLEHRKHLVSVEECVEALKSMKAIDILAFNMHGKVLYVQNIIIVTGMSTRHMKSLGKCIMELMEKKRPPGMPRSYLEGEDTDDWMIVDVGNIMVHIFSEQGRNHWDLDRKFAFETISEGEIPPDELKKY